MAPRLLYLSVVLLWALTAWNRSLWIDELHALGHARSEDLGAFFAAVRSDNHPPLSFLLLRWSIQLLGEGHLAVRLPGLVAALLFARLSLRVARRLPDPAARAWAPWLVLLSSYRLMVFTEARMYGWLALFVLGTLEALLASLQDGRRAWRATPWVALGLHTHYFFFHYLFVLGLWVVLAGSRDPARRPAVVRLCIALAAGGLFFLPWLFFGFLEQLEHGLPAGANYDTPALWLQSIAHLLFMNASLAGEWATRYVALPGAVAAAWLGWCGLRRLSVTASPPLTSALFVCGLVVPLWAFACSFWIPRNSYNWPYISGSMAPVLFLVAAGAGAGAPGRAGRRALAAVVVLTLSVVTVVGATSRGQEDYRGCVEFILARARPGDAIVTRGVWDADPEGSPSGWQYYLDRIAPETALPREYRLPDYRGALEHDRVWTFVRRRWSRGARETLSATYPNEAVYPIGPVMTVRVFWR